MVNRAGRHCSSSAPSSPPPSARSSRPSATTPTCSATHWRTVPVKVRDHRLAALIGDVAATDFVRSCAQLIKSLVKGLSVRFFKVAMPMVVDFAERLTGKILSDRRSAPNWTTDLENTARKRPVASIAKCIGRDVEFTTARGIFNPCARKGIRGKHRNWMVRRREHPLLVNDLGKFNAAPASPGTFPIRHHEDRFIIQNFEVD